MAKRGAERFFKKQCFLTQAYFGPMLGTKYFAPSGCKPPKKVMTKHQAHSIFIREGTSDDAEFFLEMEEQTTWESLPPDKARGMQREHLREKLLETHGLLLECPGNVFFIAENAATGERAGLLWLGPRHNLITGEHEAWIYNVSVVPRCRGCGIAKKLMAYAEEYARTQGYGVIGLSVAVHNDVARSLSAIRVLGKQHPDAQAACCSLISRKEDARTEHRWSVIGRHFADGAGFGIEAFAGSRPSAGRRHAGDARQNTQRRKRAARSEIRRAVGFGTYADAAAGGRRCHRVALVSALRSADVGGRVDSARRRADADCPRRKSNVGRMAMEAGRGAHLRPHAPSDGSLDRTRIFTRTANTNAPIKLHAEPTLKKTPNPSSICAAIRTAHFGSEWFTD